MQHKLNTQNARPIKQPPTRVPIHLQNEVDGEIKKMLDANVIRPSNSPWSSCVVAVRKPSGKLRLCLDYRKLNEVTVKDAYPLPKIDASLDKLSESEWFSTLDLASGFHQVEMDHDDRPKTAFSTRQGLFEFNTMPFGSCNAPATFERLMEQVMAGLQWEILLVYMDDLIAYAGSFKSMMERLECIFQCIREANLKLNAEKCTLFQNGVSFLGYYVNKDGVATDHAKIEKVQNWPQPSCVSEVRSFLGLCSYYRRFVKGYTHLAGPLHRLTENGVKFEWSSSCEQSFTILKDHLVSAQILAFPKETGKFILDTDASNDGIGAVLSQIQHGEEKVIAYASRALSRSERRYCVTRRELLAVVRFITHFKHYLYGQEISIKNRPWVFKVVSQLQIT